MRKESYDSDYDDDIDVDVDAIAEAEYERDEPKNRRRDEDEDDGYLSNKKTLDLLAQNNVKLQQRLSQQDKLIWEQRLTEFNKNYNAVGAEITKAEQVLARAIASADGDDAAYAIKYRDECLAKKRSMEIEYNNFQTMVKNQDEQVQQAMVRKERYQNNFLREVGWDQLSAEQQEKIIAIDTAMSLENDPTTHQYFSKLKREASKIISGQSSKSNNYKSNNNNEEREQRRRDTRERIVVSPERKEALIQAGVWDDPKQRLKYLRSFQQWDRENKGVNRRDPF